MGILVDMYQAPNSNAVVDAMRVELRRNLIELDMIEPTDADDDATGLAAFDSVHATGLWEHALLGELIAVIRRVPYDEGLANQEMVWPNGSREFEGFEAYDEPGPWVTGFDIEFRDTLADVPDAEIAEIARCWGGTGAAVEFGASPEVLRDIVDRFVHFARDARMKGNRLYLWVSL